MKLKKSYRRSRMCGTKKPYETAKAAQQAARAATAKTGERTGAFKGQWCHCFHISHTPWRVRKFMGEAW